MGIIAFLTAIGAPALMSVRNQYVLDAVVEEMVTTIRDVQNRSISIKSDDKGNNTKVWGVKINSTTEDFGIYSIYGASPVSEYAEKSSLTPYKNVDIKSNATVYFTAPFGKSYVNSSATGCLLTSWGESTNPEKDYEPTGCVFQTSDLNIQIEFKGQSKIVVIRPNGDVYAK